MEKAYRHLPYFFLLAIPITLAAFYPTYLVQFPNFSERNDGFTHVHGIISVVWLAMLIAQPFLIRNKKYELHRKVGRLSYVVFPLLILSFIPQIVKSSHYNFVTIFFPIADSVVMIVLYSLAIYNRNDSSKHMRYMIGMTLVFLFPTLGRIEPIWLGIVDTIGQDINYGIIYMILIGLSFYDRSHQKDFKPYLVSIPFFAMHQLVFHLLF
ncbi:MAG TPA: hypothetical protein VL728_17620 [Cyclobacteriaceae bacterium]|nr:hypothetical protein [Cyclobacteriaceae bacterium]